MITLYKYIFYKAYYFCIRIFNEREFPWFFASGILSLIVVITLVTLLEIIEYIILPNRINFFSEYQGYFALGVLFALAFYVKSENRYITIIEECKSISQKRQRLLFSIAIVYSIVLVFIFLLIGYLLQQYNSSHSPRLVLSQSPWSVSAQTTMKTTLDFHSVRTQTEDKTKSKN